MIVPVRLVRDLDRAPPRDLRDLFAWMCWNLQADPDERSDAYTGTVSAPGASIEVELTFAFSGPARPAWPAERLTLSLPGDLRRALDVARRRRGVSTGCVVAQLVQAHLAAELRHVVTTYGPETF